MKCNWILFILFFSSKLVAQKATQQDYINTYHKLAQKEQLRTGVPAAITLAQGILESENGNSKLSTKSNNHFGIKCKSNWTGERVYHNDDARGECFRKYESVEQSFIDHSDFLKNNERYAALFTLDINDYEGWAKGLKAAGYATNPVYADKLIQLIEKNELQKFNDLGYSTIESTELAIATSESNAEQPAATDVPTATIKTEKPKETNIEIERTVPIVYNKITEVNRTKAIFFPAGTSLLAIAANNEIELEKLLEFNDLPKSTSDILAKASIIYLQRKRKEGEQATYTCKTNQTIYEVAQQLGIRLESLQKMNESIKSAEIKAGTQLTTQSKSKK